MCWPLPLALLLARLLHLLPYQLLLWPMQAWMCWRVRPLLAGLLPQLPANCCLLAHAADFKPGSCCKGGMFWRCWVAVA